MLNACMHCCGCKVVQIGGAIPPPPRGGNRPDKRGEIARGRGGGGMHMWHQYFTQSVPGLLLFVPYTLGPGHCAVTENAHHQSGRGGGGLSGWGRRQKQAGVPKSGLPFPASSMNYTPPPPAGENFF